MMLFPDIKTQIKSIGFQMLRTENDAYFEVVFLKPKLEEYGAALSGIFGKISWPSDNPIPADVKAVIAQYGSVMAGQTLYAVQEGEHIMFAMLWPWGDREHITLKIGEKNRGRNTVRPGGLNEAFNVVAGSGCIFFTLFL